MRPLFERARARFAATGRREREWMVIALVASVSAGLLGGLTTHDEVGWRQMTGFALAITFYAIFALGLSLEFGYTGLLNLGHVGFMAIGGYTYGILLMAGGRPADPGFIVGWLHEQTGSLQGATLTGFIACLFLALLTAGLVLIPLLLTLESAARVREKDAGRRALAWLGAGVVGAVLVYGALAIGPGGRPTFVGILLLSIFFGGALLALVGALQGVRWALELLVGATPLGRSRRARSLVAAGIALGVGALVLWASFPLGPVGALAMAAALATVLGMAIAALVALVLGLPAIRLREDFLAIVTLGFAEIFRLVISTARAGESGGGIGAMLAKLGGQNGYQGINNQGVPLYAGPFWVFGLAFLLGVVAWRIKFSGWGRALRALREDDIAAAAVGVDPTQYKVTSFVIAAVGAGIAGGLMAIMRDGIPVNPENYNFQASFDAITMVILGGSGSVSGAAIGGLLITFTIKAIELVQGTRVVQDLKASFESLDLNALRMIIYAVILIVMMIVRPEGILGERELFSKKQPPKGGPPNKPKPTEPATAGTVKA